jgi:putative intracellular protease/amidase
VVRVPCSPSTPPRTLHRKFVESYQSGKLTAALCHGVAILRSTRRANGEPLVRGKTVTGFANIEEDFSEAPKI